MADRSGTPATWYLPDWDEATTFLTAVALGDVPRIRAMVAGGTSVETVSATEGELAIELAAKREQPEAVRCLVELGADVQARSPHGSTVLHWLGTRERLIDLIPLVLGRGADINAADASGSTPLIHALAAACVPGARALLRHGADPLARDADGSTTVLRFVHAIDSFRPGDAHALQLALLRELLERGVDPGAAGWLGRTAVTIAADKGLQHVVLVLRDFGASVSAPDRRGLTPVQAAALAKRRVTADALLGGGAPLDFFSAVLLNRPGAVRAALAASPALASAVLEPEATSALSLAVAHGQAGIVRLLLAAGADPNGPNRWTSCLHAAVQSLPDPEIVRLLLRHGARVDAADGDGNTPLNLAARAGNLALARILLEHGADVNAPTERGTTPMGFAATDAMRRLLASHGGRPRA